MFNPYDRRPALIHLDTRRNRKVSRPVVEAKPAVRNLKLVTLRSRKLDDVVLALLLALVMFATGSGLCFNAITVIAPRTPDALLESSITLFGLGFFASAVHFIRKARLAWKDCENFDDRLARRSEALASVIRSTERKPPVTFHDEMY